jgi:hypothetical protein
MSIPSITIRPCAGSTKRSTLIASVLLPEPVRPRRPTRSRARSSSDTPRSTGGSSGAYRIVRSSIRMSVWPAVLLGQYAGGREPSMIAGGSCGRSRYSTTRSTELRTHQPLPLFDVGTTHFKSSSSPVQNRHAQYTPDVNAMADVMHTPARPASTTPESAKSVVTNTVHAPTTSKRRSSQRFIIQNPYHI